jgi:hypothetical protein
MVLLQNLPHNKFGVCLQMVRCCDSVILCCKLWDATNIDITQYILFKFHYTHFNALKQCSNGNYHTYRTPRSPEFRGRPQQSENSGSTWEDLAQNFWKYVGRSYPKHHIRIKSDIK